MRHVVINATNIGLRLNGLGVYSLNLLGELTKLDSDIEFTVLLNRNARAHTRELKFPGNFAVKWVTRRLSPDYGFAGHLPRLVFSNLLSSRYGKSLIFNMSQMEAIFWRENQVITVHDLIPLLFPNDHRRQFHYFKYYLPPVLRRAARVITDSHHSAKLLMEHYGLSQDRVKTIYLGFDRQFCPAPAPKKDYLLFVGRASPTKNLPGLLKALQIVRESYRLPVRLRIAGSTSIGADTDGVEVLGQIPTVRLVQLYREAALLVFPSFYEGFGLPPLEAMACGCPVVVSDAASLPEVCGDAACYVDPHDAESIAEGISRVLTDEALRRNMIEKGMARAAFFSWKTTARESLDVLSQALERCT